MGKRVKATAALCVVAIAALCQIEVDSNRWISSKSILLRSNIDDAFNFITTADYMNRWFPFVSHVREADARPLGVGKKYRATCDIPMWGEYNMQYRIVEYSHKSRVVVESDFFLKPHIEFHFTSKKENECIMEVQVSFKHLSYFFQYAAGPILYFITNQQLQRSLFLLRLVFPY